MNTTPSLETLHLIDPAPSPYVRNETAVSSEAQAVFSRLRDLALGTYMARTPYAPQVIDALKKDGARIINDHVALRTFKDKQGVSGLEVLEKVFLAFGYRKEDNIPIEALHLNCYWYEPPASTNWPKVFISEQQTERLPEAARSIVYSTIGSYYSERPWGDIDFTKPAEISAETLVKVLETPPWNPSSTDYESLQSLSKEHTQDANALQYAAWTLVHGHRWNHFTVLLNTLGLSDLKILEDLNTYLKDKGFPLNSFGGNEIQGSNEKLLKQSSTLANPVDHKFSDGKVLTVPGSFVEFIERFMVEDQPMRGFRANNAKGIFTSTNRR